VEAARLDGASDLQIARKVMLPLAWPGFLTVALIVGLWSWNEFFWAITFIHDPQLRPISTSFMAFQDQYSTDWGLAPAFGHAELNLWDPEAKFQRRFG